MPVHDGYSESIQDVHIKRVCDRSSQYAPTPLERLHFISRSSLVDIRKGVESANTIVFDHKICLSTPEQSLGLDTSRGVVVCACISLHMLNPSYGVRNN